MDGTSVLWSQPAGGVQPVPQADRQFSKDSGPAQEASHDCTHLVSGEEAQGHGGLQAGWWASQWSGEGAAFRGTWHLGAAALGFPATHMHLICCCLNKVPHTCRMLAHIGPLRPEKLRRPPEPDQMSAGDPASSSLVGAQAEHSATWLVKGWRSRATHPLLTSVLVQEIRPDQGPLEVTDVGRAEVRAGPQNHGTEKSALRVVPGQHGGPASGSADKGSLPGRGREVLRLTALLRQTLASGSRPFPPLWRAVPAPRPARA
ncbi:hypothetical protein H1C71_035111 [Ictidomys tridecemlineatus]|nr:hypothetical protein H1C71_035111 [Ictidomys tridecemlineatus]